jgi:hypothetical protein
MLFDLAFLMRAFRFPWALAANRGKGDGEAGNSEDNLHLFSHGFFLQKVWNEKGTGLRENVR